MEVTGRESTKLCHMFGSGPGLIGDSIPEVSPTFPQIGEFSPTNDYM